MPRLMTLACLIAAVALLSPTPGLSRVPSRPNADPECVDGWRLAPGSEGVPLAQALGVASDASGSWLAGYYNVGRAWPRVVRWDGVDWTTSTLESIGPAMLSSITTTPTSAAWVVGYRYASRVVPAVERWNGTAWQRLKTPALTEGALLSDVAAWDLRHAIGVGYSQTTAGTRPLAIRWAGGAATLETLPVPRQGALLGVAGSGPTDTWAVGWSRSSGAFRALVLRRTDRAGWSRVSLGGIVSGAVILTSVAVRAPDDVWMAGLRQIASGWAPLILRWNGERLVRVRPPRPTTDMPVTVLRSIAVSGGQMLVAGVAWDPQERQTSSLLGRGGTAGWEVTMDAAGVSSADLGAVAAQGLDAMVVGRVGREMLALVPCSDERGSAPRTTGRGDDDRSVSAPPRDADEPIIRPRPVKGLTAAEPLPRPVTDADWAYRDVAASVGLEASHASYGSVAADLDGDGWTDLVIGRHGAPLRVLRNDDGTFVPFVDDPFPQLDRHGCDVGDVDGDDIPDIVCATGAVHGTALKSNELWLSPGTGRLVDRAADRGLDDPFGRGRQVAIFDADHDGDMDVFITNEPSRVDGLPSSNQLFRNQDGDRFVRAPEAGLDQAIGGSCAEAADIDDDGWTDLVLCGLVALDGEAFIRAYRNVKGRFVPVTSEWRISSIGELDAEVADVNGDRRLDIVQLSSRRLRVSLQRRNGTFGIGVDYALTGASAVAVGDIDGDANADIYVVRRRSGETNLADVLLLGAGDGRSFTSVTLDQAADGDGESVTPIDRDRDGRTGFLVLNGGTSTRGPVQLIEARPLTEP